MKVEVTYLAPGKRFVTAIVLPEGATVAMAIEYSGVLRQFPEIDMDKQKVGVYGKVKPLNTVLGDGDRVEIYRPVTVDPATVKRRKVGGDDGDSEA